MPITTFRRTRPECTTRTRVRLSRTLPSVAPTPQWDFGAGLRFVWKWRLIIIALVAAVTGLTALYSWQMPDRYTASATLLSNPPSERLSTLASLGPRITMALGGTGLHSDKVIYPTLLRSRSVIEPILTIPLPTRNAPPHDDFTLASMLGTDNPEKGCDAVRGMMEATHDGITGVSRITVTMEDPVTAAAVCNGLVRSLAQRSVSFRTADAHKVRSFIADRLVEIKTELVDAEHRLQEFRNKNRNYSRTANPDLLLDDERLSREVTLKSNLYLQLFQEYESARIEEKRDIASVQILDSAYIPTEKSGPHRIRTTVTAGVMSGPCAVTILLACHFILHALRPEDQRRLRRKNQNA